MERFSRLRKRRAEAGSRQPLAARPRALEPSSPRAGRLQAICEQLDKELLTQSALLSGLYVNRGGRRFDFDVGCKLRFLPETDLEGWQCGAANGFHVVSLPKFGLQLFGEVAGSAMRSVFRAGSVLFRFVCDPPSLGKTTFWKDHVGPVNVKFGLCLANPGREWWNKQFRGLRNPKKLQRQLVSVGSFYATGPPLCDLN